MNSYFDSNDYGEVFLYQYAHACPRISVYRGDIQGFADNTKVEVRHSCCDCPGNGCGTWHYYMKGSGIWIDLGKTKIFPNHYDAVLFFLPGQAYNNQPRDLHILARTARAAGYDTLQFLSNNEYGIFLFEILDTRNLADTNGCPSNAQPYHQYASKPYDCQCVGGECLNCFISNNQFKGHFPPCTECYNYKFNTACLNSCPQGTIAKKTYYADEKYICLYDGSQIENCGVSGCKACGTTKNQCQECYDEYVLKNGQCVIKKKKGGNNLEIKILILFLTIFFFL